MQDYEIDNAPPKTPGGFIDGEPPSAPLLSTIERKAVPVVEPEPEPVDLDSLTVKELRAMAKEQRIPKYRRMKKAKLIKAITA